MKAKLPIAGDNSMRTTIFVIIIAMMILSGCSNDTIVDSNSYVSGQDQQYFYLNNLFDGYGICETEQSYYFLGAHDKKYLFICDKEKEKAVPLCNKPNCLHARETNSYKVTECNAFLGIDPQYLQIYQNSIYYVDTLSSPPREATSKGFIKYR